MFSNIGLENDVRQLEVNCDTDHLGQVKEREIYALPLVFFFPFSFLPPPSDSSLHNRSLMEPRFSLLGLP